MEMPSNGASRSGVVRPGTVGSVVAVTLLSLILASCGSGNGSGSSTTIDTQLADGIHAQAKGDSALAVADYLAVVKRDPSNKLAWYDLGVIAHQAGQDTEAAKDYQAALAADPHYVPALYNLAILKTATDPKTAEQLYETAAEVEPKNAKVHLNLGFVLKMLGQDAKGNAEIAQAVKLDPSLAPRVPTGTMQPG